jgi:hypothetical protein
MRWLQNMLVLLLCPTQPDPTSSQLLSQAKGKVNGGKPSIGHLAGLGCFHLSAAFWDLFCVRVFESALRTIVCLINDF